MGKVAYENPLMNNEMLRRIHAYMVQCRAEANGSSGVEAIEVATLVHIRPGDTIATSGNQWTAARIGTSALARMMKELFPEQGEQGLPKVISKAPSASALVGVATGVAFGCKAQASPNAVVVFGDRGLLGRGNTPIMEFAGERKLPVLYVVETNLGDSVPSAGVQKMDDEINSTAAKSGFPAIPVDGHDAVAVYRVVQEAIARARKGGGPTLIDCKTWRGKKRKSTALGLDPIVHMEQYLRKRGLTARTV